MRDAGELCSRLVQVHNGETTLQEALSEYEKEMIKRGASATKDSHEATFFAHSPLTIFRRYLMYFGSAALKVSSYISSAKSYVFDS
jgi:hypothetical protein